MPDILTPSQRVAQAQADLDKATAALAAAATKELVLPAKTDAMMRAFKALVVAEDELALATPDTAKVSRYVALAESWAILAGLLP